MLEDKLAIQLQGKSEPGMGGPVSSGSNEQAPRPDLPTPPAGCSTYVNVAHGFSIGYPQSFFVQPQEVSKLSRFTPTPVASMFFMNPTMASGALAGIEPPDPEVRVYRAEAADSLKNWLFSGGIASSAGSAGYQPYRSASVDGLKVCHSTLIAPGCSVYVLHSGRVYQLMPVSREGEAMIGTFALL